MKKLLLLTVFLASFAIAQAKTTMTLTSGEEIDVIIETIGTNEITYKKASNPTGPSYTTARSNVFFIVYDNGYKEVFTNLNQQQATAQATPQPSSQPQAQSHAQGGTLAGAIVQQSNTLTEQLEVEKKNYFPSIQFYPRFNIGFHATPSGYKDSYDIDWGGLAYSFDVNVLLPTGNETAWSVGLGMASLSGEMQMLYTTNNGKDKHKDKMGDFDAMYLTIPIEYFTKCGDWFTLGIGNRFDILVSQKMGGKKIEDAFNGFRDATYIDGICTIGNFDIGARILLNFTSAFKTEDWDWSPTIGMDLTVGYRF